MHHSAALGNQREMAKSIPLHNCSGCNLSFTLDSIKYKQLKWLQTAKDRTSSKSKAEASHISRRT